MIEAIDAVIVGVGQGLAVLPGISRSGTTVSLLLLRGYVGQAASSPGVRAAGGGWT